MRRRNICHTNGFYLHKPQRTMKTNSPDTGETTGDNKLATIPTGMEHDPKADEEVIDQQDGEQYPEAVAEKAETNDELANSIAYALDGSGPGPSNSPVNGEAHKVITEGVTGAGPEDEEDAAREWRSL